MAILFLYYLRGNKMIIIDNAHMYYPLLPFLPLFYGIQIIIAKDIPSLCLLCLHIIYGKQNDVHWQCMYVLPCLTIPSSFLWYKYIHR